MKIEAIVATTFKDKENGWSYTASALKELADTVNDIPVIYNKEKIGTIIEATYEAEKVSITAKIDNPKTLLPEHAFMVPGGLTDFETNGDLIQKCVAHQFFITEKPSDTTLTPLTVIAEP